MGPPPRSLAAEANGCFMVRVRRGPNRIQGCGARDAPDSGLPSDQSKHASTIGEQSDAIKLDTDIPIQGRVKTPACFHTDLFGSHCVSCCFERWRALSERDRAGAAAGRGSRTGRRHNFSIHPLPKSENALLCGGVQNRRRVARVAASRQGEGRGENSYLESAVTH